MKKIYFVRHSIRDAKIKDDYSAPLTAEGKQLADDLVGYFVDKNIKAIIHHLISVRCRLLSQQQTHWV